MTCYIMLAHLKHSINKKIIIWKNNLNFFTQAQQTILII